MMSRKRKVKSSTTTNAVAFHRPWYDLLLVVALLLACGSLCCRMAVSETHLFGFGHKKSVDGLSNLLDVRQRRQAPLRMDPVLGTTVALEHLRSRQAKKIFIRTHVNCHRMCGCRTWRLRSFKCELSELRKCFVRCPLTFEYVRVEYHIVFLEYFQRNVPNEQHSRKYKFSVRITGVQREFRRQPHCCVQQ
ncbi:membrane-associated protein, putative [Bodo saltans]|uniref:Membrane-associated protein, putative n=1 Tax=Bodo saltans TaxID=75058 RepID=A0A0S4JH69_BODSA|nr:membrane-associated protein, putative [Bodo saltans]|eukprot:CUG89575.1 membrane-associated protein, putative [Bodo saltans]